MFAVFCPRHGCKVLLGPQRIRAVRNLGPGIVAVELTCFDGEELVVLTGARVTEGAERRRGDAAPRGARCAS